MTNTEIFILSIISVLCIYVSISFVIYRKTKKDKISVITESPQYHEKERIIKPVRCGICNSMVTPKYVEHSKIYVCPVCNNILARR